MTDEDIERVAWAMREASDHNGLELTYDACEPLARAAIAAMTQWQPIETAPKDGTRVLLYAGQQQYEGKPTEPRLTYGYWLIFEHGDYLGDCGGECRCPEYNDPPEPIWYSEDGGFTPENPPTHWMPLPSPPNGS